MLAINKQLVTKYSLRYVCMCEKERRREKHALSVVFSPAECLIMQAKVSKCQMLWSPSPFLHSAPPPLQWPLKVSCWLRTCNDHTTSNQHYTTYCEYYYSIYINEGDKTLKTPGIITVNSFNKDWEIRTELLYWVALYCTGVQQSGQWVYMYSHIQWNENVKQQAS